MNPSLPLYTGRLVLLRHELPKLSCSSAESGPNLHGNQPLEGIIDDESAHRSRLDQSHWDLMLELDNQQLICWQIPLNPFEICGEIIGSEQISKTQEFQAVRIADHRGLYLDYEGPISGGRGWVKRVATGSYAACLVQSVANDTQLYLATKCLLDSSSHDSKSQALPISKVSEGGRSSNSVEEESEWLIGGFRILRSNLRSGQLFQFRVRLSDHTTMRFTYHDYPT